MFLHLLTDEKFIDDAITRFNRNDPGNHTFLLVYKDGFGGFRYIKQTGNVETVLTGSEKHKEYLSNLPAYDAVFVHSLFNPCNVDIINNAPAGTTFVWLFWGGEMWRFKHIRSSIMLPATRRLYRYNAMKFWLGVNVRKYTSLRRQAEFKGVLSNFLKKRKLKNKTVETSGTDAMEKAIRCMRYVIPVIREDVDILKKHFCLNAEVLDWNYSLGIPLDSLEDKTICGNNILIGNSAHYSNNHLDIFKTIRKIKHWSGKIIVPLSYGDAEYKNCIIDVGTKMFGWRFMPLEAFLPVEEYYAVLESCSYAFFNTLRQQAMGNIVFLLYQGTKVFLREENPAYHFFRRNGVAVFPIHSRINQSSDDIQLISKTEAAQNRSILKSLYSEKTLDRKTRELLSILLKDNRLMK